ncbi:MAG: hypothetical protein H7Z37_16160 [Pyrinomonadaceae bacterium]|nr:hypothetical protein [Pyrinomonadaceae bacterium]
MSKNKLIPESQSLKVTIVGNQIIRYKTEKSQGGSGGAEYSLTAYKAIDNGFIEFSQSKQSESFEPNFDICWKVIESTTFDASQSQNSF